MADCHSSAQCYGEALAEYIERAAEDGAQLKGVAPAFIDIRPNSRLGLNISPGDGVCWGRSRC